MNVHQNARLTPHSRADLARRVVVKGTDTEGRRGRFRRNRQGSCWLPGVGSASCDQGGDERAEQGFAATAWVVHDLEEADFEDKDPRQGGALWGLRPRRQQRLGQPGIDHDTAQFAVNAIRTLADKMGRERYPARRQLMITADCGGSNGSRVRLWKLELQQLADETGLTLPVCHFRPAPRSGTRSSTACSATSPRTGAAAPLTSRLAVVELIATTTTKTGLTVHCELDTATYPKGIKVSDAADGNPQHPTRRPSIRNGTTPSPKAATTSHM